MEHYNIKKFFYYEKLLQDYTLAGFLGFSTI